MNLQQRVHEALNNAKENGYFDAGMELHGLEAEKIADDMIALDSDFEKFSVEELVPHIQSWLEKNMDNY